jgi:hypothetical protein
MRVSAGVSAGHVCQRVIAAVFGGYTFTVASSICFSYLLPAARFEAVMTAVLLSFLIYAGTVLWVFSIHSLKRMWLGLGGATAGCGLLAGTLKLAGVS